MITICMPTQVFSVGAFIPAVLAEIRFKNIDRSLLEEVSEIPNNLFLKTEVTAGLVFATTGLLCIFGIVALVGRICNYQHEDTSNRNVFTCLVSVNYVVLACMHSYITRKKCHI